MSENNPTDLITEQSVILLKHIDHHAGLGILLVSADGTIIFINNSLSCWLGLTEVYQPQDLKYLNAALYKRCFSQKKMDSGKNQFEFFDFKLNRKGLTEEIDCEILKIPIAHKPNNDYLIFCWFKPQIAIDDSTNIQNKILKSLISRAPIGILSIDLDWQCQFANEEMSQLTCLSREELYGRGWISLFSDNSDLLQQMINSLLSSGYAKVELELTQPSFGRRILELDVRGEIDENGGLEHAVCAFIDVTERVERQQEIHNLANFDSVTGLSNRLSLKHQLTRYMALAKKLKQKVQLMFIDLDGFKTINDLYGHGIGDQVLVQVAQRLTRQVRQTDVVARFGGDEFVILMPGEVPDQVVDKIGCTLNKVLRHIYVINDIAVHLTASIGIASFIGDEKSGNMQTDLLVDELLKQADLAMYQAKHKGKNLCLRYDTVHGHEITLAYSIGQLLPSAISKQQIQFYYQPIVDNNSNKLIGVEALLRWHDENQGWINPEKAINVAEANGMIISLQNFMLAQVIKDFTEIMQLTKSAYPKLRLSINICALQLMERSHCQYIWEQFERSGIESSQVTIELTENTLIENSTEVYGNLQFLREKGFIIALDDFGTGYSSLSYLTQFPIDIVKLDKTFILSMQKTQQQIALVSGCIKLIHSLSKQVVAEGVESKDDLQLLQSMKCDYVQGYYYSKALALTALGEWIVQHFQSLTSKNSA